jgi:hypothetical protein
MLENPDVLHRRARFYRLPRAGHQQLHTETRGRQQAGDLS